MTASHTGRATLRVGTRASALAQAQTSEVARQLVEHLRVAVELVPVVSFGDRTRGALAEIGGTGVFVTALREALVSGRIDLAVHSLKDLPTTDDMAIRLAAVPRRADPRDALVARSGLTLDELPPGARVGTGSPRRAAQLLAVRSDLDVVPIRGNVDTRIAKVSGGSVDAVVLAVAGLARLGRDSEITETLDPDRMLPAPGQGALAVEVAEPARQLAADIAGVLDDDRSSAGCAAERAVLREMEAGCSSPIGALADVASQPGAGQWELSLRAVVVAPDGGRSIRLSATGPAADPVGLGTRLAQALLAEGAAELTGEPVS